MDLNTAKLELRFPPLVSWVSLTWELLAALTLALSLFTLALEG